jgi:hypothetical protein
MKWLEFEVDAFNLIYFLLKKVSTLTLCILTLCPNHEICREKVHIFLSNYHKIDNVLLNF